MERRCTECGEIKVRQDEPSDLGHDYVVMGCFSEFYFYPEGGTPTLIRQGDLCKERVIESLKSFSRLSPAERERLFWLIEELGEVQQIVGKIGRHGYESTWPPGESPTNRALLEKELRDVLFVIKLMDKSGDICYIRIIEDLYNKSYKNCYLHHQNIVEMCGNCGKNPATPLHNCPYSEEINDDHESLCNCCEECESECRDDI